ncbi:hypothetical protein CFC21_058222 [Triticum aestivum]|uniref:RING-type E3 ubiquitin transferase n=2 Tax=Triticum aestivum TaxID=4565 RepID=A0A3B6RMR4_WHEAT|nr:RING-H2 finger protein ATL70-like [Triticum dicoccoides]XP_044429457.1 RING-H2 finger protein ATL70-like [Triticum aestivum]KAF7049734.1 hypothetical protein CFC21_058222 [Triticum aestivum]
MGTGGPSPPGAPHGLFGSSGAGGFGYGLAVSVGILLLVCTVAFAVYLCCARASSSMPVADARGIPAPAPPRRGNGDVELGGIDAATLEAYPAVVYREARKPASEEGQHAACCAVCLERYADSDVVRVLPDCGHLFHRGCVDAWLRRRPTCPVCRTSPLPSPMPTPLAEVTPLALPRPA